MDSLLRAEMWNEQVLENFYDFTCPDFFEKHGSYNKYYDNISLPLRTDTYSLILGLSECQQGACCIYQAGPPRNH